MSNKKSRVLMVIICSNHKISIGESNKYVTTNALRECLLEEHARKLYEGRRKIRALITSDSVTRNRMLLRDLDYNADLVHGPDFQLTDQLQGGLYLPAGKRYAGKFYQALGPDGSNLLVDSEHHVLIVSGLYGLLTPAELIQCYSCHVPDHPNITEIWTRHDRLTNVLLAYVRHFGITKVFDFMAVAAYRNLVSWEKIHESLQGDVLHVHSTMFAGDPLLPTLGVVAEKFLTAPEDALLRIQAGYVISMDKHRILFQSSPVPKPPAMQEKTSPIVTRFDAILRMHQNLGRILTCISRVPPKGKFSDRLQQCSASLPTEIKRQMRRINEVRNAVIHEDYEINKDEEWEEISNAYVSIEVWARRSNYICMKMEEIDT